MPSSSWPSWTTWFTRPPGFARWPRTMSDCRWTSARATDRRRFAIGVHVAETGAATANCYDGPQHRLQSEIGGTLVNKGQATSENTVKLGLRERNKIDKLSRIRAAALEL